MIGNDIVEPRAMRSNRKSEDVAKLVHMDKLFAIVVDSENFQCTASKRLNRYVFVLNSLRLEISKKKSVVKNPPLGIR